MAVNGVQINTGQVWSTGAGNVRIEQTRPQGWSVKALADGRTYFIDFEGRFYFPAGGSPSQKERVLYDLIALVDATQPTKETNPKEAIGDKKVPLWLCSAIAQAHWSAAQLAGLVKYGAWNWRAAGVRSSTYISAIKRHLARWTNGERLDPVDGTHHLGNIMACAAILLEAEYLGKLNDDRPPPADLQKAFDEIEAVTARIKEKYADKSPKHWTISDKV